MPPSKDAISAEQALANVPEPVRAIVDALVKAGFEAYLVGGCVRDLLQGAPVRDFDVATSARPEAVLERFPRAIPIGLQHGTVMIPTPAGPTDVTSFRAGPRIEDDLAHRDFTLNALAADLERGQVLDPHGGRKDLAARHLRPVGSAAARFAEDPLRALRGIRLAVTHGLTIDAATVSAMRGARDALRRVPRERVRREIEEILLSPAAPRGLGLLRDAGLEGDLVPEAAPDTARVIAALPPDLALRLAAWLRGGNPGAVLPRLRFPRRLVKRVALLVRLHPVDECLGHPGAAATRRLLKRAGVENIEPLIALQRAELEAVGGNEARERLAGLEALRANVAAIRSDRELALHRLDLAIGGRDVMRILGWGPGPHIGAALRHLTDRVVEDPSHNEPERLRELLLAWSETADAAVARRAPRWSHRATTAEEEEER